MDSNILWFIVVLGIQFSNAVDTGRYNLVTKTKVPYETAVTNCESDGKEILTLHTSEDYDEFLNWLPILSDGVHGQEKDIWVGLKQIETGEQNYAWVDDNSPLEKQPCWKSDEPSDNNQIQCAYMDTNEGKLSTEICTETRTVACYDPVLGKYTITSKAETFYNASEECSKLGQHLPIIKTTEQRDGLKQATSNSENVWVGLIEVESNIYLWINGDGLPRYKWDNKESGNLVHGHRADRKENCFELHAPDKEEDNQKPRPYVCQKKKRNSTLDNYFKLEEANAMMYLAPLNVSYILKRTECAVQCSKDPTCLQYTLNGSVCKTYGKGLYFISHQNGVKLFKRRIVSNYL
ncbi:hypothetical protein LOTGIDRAFT_236669 [Lottia gigantea]|uniref:C-type lectin domain-containing protein n=1 Tax=Lottia gigantea TaxID=225164 RepID=V4B4K1_LOTGI|nr:hypothetical protein LOTGIDRAFT_236669 [Lottia gigantea]ESO83349.1 hypothetical protein LOTGIDRAFT_236669 [Lottia gigantea]